MRVPPTRKNGVRLLMNTSPGAVRSVAGDAPPPPTPELIEELQKTERLEAAGRTAEAEVLYRGLMLKHPGQPLVLHGLGLLLYQKGELGDAQALLRGACVLDPANAELCNSLGVVLQSSGQLADAEAAYRRALQLNPSYAEAHFNLGVLLEEGGRPDEALPHHRSAAALQPRYARALTRIGAILQRQGAAAEALDHLDRAVAAAPKFFDARYYRGTVLSGLRRHDEAQAALEQAYQLRPDSYEAALALGNVLRDAQRHEMALNAYWRAVQLRPVDGEAHEQINRLAWSTGRRDLYLRSFDFARQAVGPQVVLLLMEAAFHMRMEQFAKAEDLLWRARAMAPGRSDISGMLARSLAWQGKFEEAYAFFEKAIDGEPLASMHRCELGFALLRDHQAAQARDVFDKARLIDPSNQLLLAGLTVSLRQLGDSRYQRLVDPERYVRVYDIRPPSGFAGAHAFNEALARELDSLHTTRFQPIDQTLRGGTQTLGQLFDAPTPLIVEVRHAIAEAVQNYVRQLPDDAAHPMRERAAAGAGDFSFIGSWSCRLSSRGFHTNHVHPMGWISSAYYVRLPGGIDDEVQRQGWLRFGESNMVLNEHDSADRYVKPEVGRLVLFPSFYWHGTVPFSDDHDRLSIAFDAVPAAGAAAAR